MRRRAAAFLESPRLPVWLAAISALLVAPSLFAGLATEDFVFRDATRLPFSLGAVNLYGGPDLPGMARKAQFTGVVPWIASDKLFLSFWRPLASLTHQLDYRLLDGFVPLMHLESIAVHGLVVFLAARLYLKLVQPRRIAAFAAVMFAFDHTQGHAVGWLANRNAVLAAAFGLLALATYDRFRRDGWKPGAVLAPLLVFLALLSGEIGLGVLAYFVAYAIWIDSGSRGRRLLALVPSLGVAALWAFLYRRFGHGAHDSGIYLDPVHQLGGFLRAVPGRFGALLLGQLALPPSDAWTVLSDATRPLLAVFGFVVLGLVIAAAWKGLRARASLGFCLGGALLSLLPCCSAFPSDRLLIFASFGLFGVVAEVVAGTVARALKPLAVALGVVHLGLAPLLLPLRSLTMAAYHQHVMRLSDSAYANVHAPDERLVVVNAPDYYVASLLRNMQLYARHEHVPPMICFAGTLAPIQIRRVDPNTLEVRTETSFLDQPFDRIYRNPEDRSRVGDSVFVGTAEVTVTEVTNAGVARAARFRFVWPLDSGKLDFVAYRDGRYVLVPPPASAEWVTLRGT